MRLSVGLEPATLWLCAIAISHTATLSTCTALAVLLVSAGGDKPPRFFGKPNRDLFSVGKWSKTTLPFCKTLSYSPSQSWEYNGYEMLGTIPYNESCIFAHYTLN